MGMPPSLISASHEHGDVLICVKIVATVAHLSQIALVMLQCTLHAQDENKRWRYMRSFHWSAAQLLRTFYSCESDMLRHDSIRPPEQQNSDLPNVATNKLECRCVFRGNWVLNRNTSSMSSMETLRTATMYGCQTEHLVRQNPRCTQSCISLSGDQGAWGRKQNVLWKRAISNT